MVFRFRLLPLQTHQCLTLLYWVGMIMVIVSLGACTHWRESYLKGAVEKASQEDIVAKLGKPWRKKEAILQDESTWIYRYVLTKAELDPAGIRTLGTEITQATHTVASMIGGQGNSNLGVHKPQCFHYKLTFNHSKILKYWIRESCTHTAL